MASLNRIILVGRLINDPETRFAVEGTPLTKFTLAVKRFVGSKDDDFINIVAWSKLAEISNQYLKKGQSVLVEGRISIRSFEDQMGQRKWATEVVASNIRFLSNIENQKSPLKEKREEENPIAEFEEFAQAAEDLPF
jgi:single-strand DNA-binding protein